MNNNTNDTISRAAAIALLTSQAAAQDDLAAYRNEWSAEHRAIAKQIRIAIKAISDLPAVTPGTEIVGGCNQPEERSQFSMVFADAKTMTATSRHHGKEHRLSAKTEARRLAERCPGRRFYVAHFDYSVISGLRENELEQATVPF